MGAKRAKRRYEQQRSNIINFQPHKHKQVQILPRNKNQETYMLKLLDARKDIVFGIGPAGTGKTLLAVQVAIKNFNSRGRHVGDRRGGRALHAGARDARRPRAAR